MYRVELRDGALGTVRFDGSETLIEIVDGSLTEDELDTLIVTLQQAKEERRRFRWTAMAEPATEPHSNS